MSKIAKLRAEFCRHFIETGEIDTAMREALERYARENAAVIQPRTKPHGRAERHYAMRNGGRAARDRQRVEEYRAFRKETGLTGVIKGPKFIGPRLPKGHTMKMFAQWRRTRYEAQNAASNPQRISVEPQAHVHCLA